MSSATACKEPTPYDLAPHCVSAVTKGATPNCLSTTPSIHQVAAGHCQSRGRFPWPAGGAWTGNNSTAPASGPSAHTVPALSAGLILQHPLLRTPPARRRPLTPRFSDEDIPRGHFVQDRNHRLPVEKEPQSETSGVSYASTLSCGLFIYQDRYHGLPQKLV